MNPSGGGIGLTGAVILTLAVTIVVLPAGMFGLLRLKRHCLVNKRATSNTSARGTPYEPLLAPRDVEDPDVGRQVLSVAARGLLSVARSPTNVDL